MANWTKNETLNVGGNSRYRVIIEGELDGYGQIPNNASLVRIHTQVKFNTLNAVARGSKNLADTDLSAGEMLDGKVFVEALLADLLTDEGFNQT